MDDTKLVDLMNQLIELAKDAQKLTNDFAALATQVAAIICEKQKSDT